MATYSMGDLKKGLKIELDGKPYKIVEYQHVKPGKGAAFVRVKIKSFIDGKVLEKTFHAGDKCEAPNLVEKEMQYLYDDGEYCQFMDVESYEQVAIADEDIGDAKKWMIDGMMVQILFHNGIDLVITSDVSCFLKMCFGFQRNNFLSLLFTYT